MADEKRYVTGLEQDQVSRALLVWLNQYPDKPVSRIELESLGKDGGMMLSTMAAMYTNEYVSGSYEVVYHFAIWYRTFSETSGDRLNALEVLNNMTKWAMERTDKPVLGPNINVLSLERNRQNTTAIFVQQFDDKAADYQALMTMNYEVKNNG